MEAPHSTNLLSVRVLTPADAEVYRTVRLRALHEQPSAFGSLPEVEPNLSETAARLSQSDDRCFFGAFEGDKLIGIIRLSRYSAPNERHRAYLAGLYVLPQFRCHGYGSELVREALSWAANTLRVRRVNLTVVTQQEPAIRLYRSFGFCIYGTEPETFSKNGQFYDEHLMTLAFGLGNDTKHWPEIVNTGVDSDHNSRSVMDNDESFRGELESQLAQFERFLSDKLKPRTIRQHIVVIVSLISFLCFDCAVKEYRVIRRGMVCSRFRRWYCSNMADLTESQVNTSVKKFFSFLVFEQGIPIGEDVLKGLKIRS